MCWHSCVYACNYSCDSHASIQLVSSHFHPLGASVIPPGYLSFSPPGSSLLYPLGTSLLYPRVCSKVLLELYRKYKDKWIVELLIQDLVGGECNHLVCMYARECNRISVSCVRDYSSLKRAKCNCSHPRGRWTGTIGSTRTVGYRPSCSAVWGPAPSMETPTGRPIPWG